MMLIDNCRISLVLDKIELKITRKETKYITKAKNGNSPYNKLIVYKLYSDCLGKIAQWRMMTGIHGKFFGDEWNSCAWPPGGMPIYPKGMNDDSVILILTYKVDQMLE